MHGSMQGKWEDPLMPSLEFFELGKGDRGKVQIDPRSTDGIMKVCRVRYIENWEVFNGMPNCNFFLMIKSWNGLVWKAP